MGAMGAFVWLLFCFVAILVAKFGLCQISALREFMQGQGLNLENFLKVPKKKKRIWLEMTSISIFH